MLCKSVSLIELSKKLFEGSRTPSQGVSSRKKAQQIRSHPFHFPRGVLGCHPHHLYCFGDRIANHSSSVTGGWFLFTCLMAFTTPPTFLHCHQPLLWVFYPISKSFCVRHPPKGRPHMGGRQRHIDSLPHQSLRGGSRLWNPNMNACPRPGGWDVGRDSRVFKKPFWGQT